MSDILYRRISYVIYYVLVLLGLATTKDPLFTAMIVILFVGEAIMETIIDVHKAERDGEEDESNKV